MSRENVEQAEERPSFFVTFAPASRRRYTRGSTPGHERFAGRPILGCMASDSQQGGGTKEFLISMDYRLSPQETTNRADLELGADGAGLSCSGSSVVADEEASNFRGDVLCDGYILCFQ